MPKILIIDDNDDIREIINETLADAGHETSDTDNGKTALKMVKKNRYDLIITDIVLPKINGIKIIKDIRKRDGSVKIIAISGGDRQWSEDSYLGHAKVTGADRVLAKPFRREDLLALVRDVFDR